MSKTSPGLSKRVATGLLAVALSVFGLAFAGPAAASEHETTTERLAGATRFGTAADVCAQLNEDDSIDTVVIASGRNFPDALAASPLAIAEGGCILLVEPDSLPDATLAALDEVDPSEVLIVGGTAAVSQDVEDAIEDEGFATERVAGDTREETAVAVAERIGAAGIEDGTVILATGNLAPDALAAGGISGGTDAAGVFPILLVRGSALSAETEAAIEELADNVIVVGGTAAVAESAADQAGDAAGDSDVERLAGVDRHETAVAVAQFAIDTLGWTIDEVILAAGRPPAEIGTFSPDALVAGPLASVRNAPILLTVSTDELGTANEEFLTENGGETTLVLCVGGTAVISNDTCEAAASAAEEAETPTTSNQTFSVPQDTQTAEQKTQAQGGTTRTCIISGITAGTTVDAVILPTEDVITGTDGTVTFQDTNSDNLADEDAAFARIVNVNGTNVTAAQRVNDITSAIGSISVTLYSDSTSFPADDVTLVVHADTAGGADNDRLNLTAPTTANALPKAPSEAFGVGCRTVFVPAEFAGGAFGPADVNLVDKTANYFTVTETVTGQTPDVAATFYYDANDTFVVNGVPQAPGETGLAAFEAVLSPRDLINTSTYAPDPAAVSTFSITDREPTAPTITASVISPTSVGVDITTASSTPGVDSYRIYRSTGAGSTTYTQIAEVAASALAAGNEYVDTGLTTGTTYNYVARAVDEGDESPNSNVETETPTAAAADTTRPGSIDIVTTTSSGLANTMDTGDVFKVVFNEAMTAPNAGDTIRVQDEDGASDTVGDIVCGTNATCTINASAETVNGTSQAANTVITVTLTAAPTTVAAGGIAGVQYPATVIDQAGFVDLAGNQWNVVNPPSTDLVIDGA